VISAGSTLVGKLVRLRPRTAADIPLFVKWYTDPDVLHWIHMSDAPAATYESEEARFLATEDDPSRMVWVIETTTGEAIGNVTLLNIDTIHGRAELGIALGEKAYWGRGCGTDAIRVLLEHVFSTMRLRRVSLITDFDNERGIRSYEKCGFVKEGVLREHRLRHGEPIDMIAMAALRDEAK
jgi:RimJ/RimL family protein N-acetyltransferase